MDDEFDFPEGTGTWRQVAMAADWLSKRMRTGGAAARPSRTATARRTQDTAYRPVPGFPGARWRPSQREAPAAPADRVRTAAQHEVFTEHERRPRHQGKIGPGTVVFVGGAFGELGSKPVFEAYKRFKDEGLPAVYFTESQGAELASWLDENAGNVRAIYAHSYGADTAATQIANGHGKGVALYTFDPVSRFPPDFEAVKRNTSHWVNYRSTSTETPADRVAIA